MSNTIILIPSRLNATRLPNKPLLKINNKSIINHVYEKALSTKIGDAYVVTGDQEIYNEVIKNGGKCILTQKNHKTGTDRIFEAFQRLNDTKVQYIINLQGDEPNIDINDLKHLNKLIEVNKPEIGTLASKIENKSNLKNENVVKVITDEKITDRNFPIALDFKRIVNNSNLNIYHHLGVYAYKPNILKKIIKLKQTNSEIKYRLEQLRAMENGIKINVALANFCPVGVDTMEDYLELKKKLEYNS